MDKTPDCHLRGQGSIPVVGAPILLKQKFKNLKKYEKKFQNGSESQAYNPLDYEGIMWTYA